MLRILPFSRRLRSTGRLAFLWLLIALLTVLVSSHVDAGPLKARLSEAGDEIRVFRPGNTTPLVTQMARPDFRPYLHPISAPDGKGVLTEASPSHHRHQTGLYWGFTRLNGRDYFHHPEGDYWKRVSLAVVTADGDAVQWQTVYDLLDESGNAILRESQIWTARDQGDSFSVDLEWTGTAQVDVTIGKYDYGGLFLRMPWVPGINGKVITATREANQQAEGKRAVWLDIGLHVEGRDDLAHLTIMDHPQNKGYPQPWRVDGQFGVGPVRARLGDWSIAKGQSETVRHRILAWTGDLSDIELRQQFTDYTGQGAYAQWLVAREEGRSAKYLTPGEAVDHMTVADGFRVNAWASEPMVTQPMAFCWDDRGRMWVAENRDYESRGKGFSADGKSRILILEDTDNDGVADDRKVFSEGIPFPAAIATGMGGLWLGAPPHLLFIPDADGDDKADQDDIQVRLTGWGIRDRHETLNSFRWGPDGWLYGCQGFATPSKVGRPRGKAKIYRHNDPFPQEYDFDGDPVDINGGIWRYHPIKDEFEVVAHGFSNPWGLDFDAHGQQFITACVIPHLWHVIPGGIYHRQGGRHFNPHIYADIRTIADHRHRSAHGGARVYQSDAFPPEYRGRLFMANIHEHAVLTDILEPSGSGYIGRHGDEFSLANNAQWIGFSVEVGPRGNLFVLDWHDADICGISVQNKETGRIFRYTPRQSVATDFDNRDADLTSLSNSQLARLQLVDSDWHARRARSLLQYRASQKPIEVGTVAALRGLFQARTSEVLRLRAMWALHVIERLGANELTRALRDPEPWIRGWAIQLLCEDFAPTDSALSQFVQMAKDDPSPIVRLFLASALQRIPADNTWQVVEQLTQHATDEDDHNLPRMIWFGLEPLVTDNTERALQLAAKSKLSLISRHISRRLVDDDQIASVAKAIARNGPAQLPMLHGLQDGLDGRYDVEAPEGWANLYAKIREQGGEPAKIALRLAQQFGDQAAAETLLSTLQDANTPLTDRLDALKGLAGQKRPELRSALPALLDDDALRRHAIRAMASFDDDGLADLLLDRFDGFSADDRLEAVHTLASRPKSGWKLTQAIKSDVIPRREIPAWVARLLQRVVGNGFLEVWGPLEQVDEQKQAQFVKYRTLLTSEAISAADAAAGRRIFQRTCAACHKLHGSGGNIGPDITGANRSSIDYLLGNILTPSAEIQDAYRMHIIVTNDGRVWSGIPAGENKRTVQLRVANREEPVTVNKSEIESRDVAPVSMMPAGQLNTMTDQEVLNLVRYLQTQRQVNP